MEEHQYKALTDHLVDGSTMEKVVKEMMQKLYEKCVPVEKREHVEKIIVQEDASRRFVFIEAKKDGGTSCRIGERYGTPLEVAHACALHYSQAKKMTG